VGLFTTGFDEPSTECIILYRATKSVPLYLQMCGRGSRTSAGKDGFLILDFGNNVLTHGFWDDPREWTLKKQEKKASGVAPVKLCKDCGALIPSVARACVFCGCVIPKTERELIAELQELTRSEAMQMARGGTVESWVLLAKAKKINSIWVVKSLCRNLQEAKQFTDLMGYASGWLWIHWRK
jgi:superfamily II DNA or RNA helicase